MPKEVDIRGDRAREFPQLEDPLSITHARVMACKFDDWAPIARLRNLVSLEVFDWLAPDFESLRPLTRLVQLRVQHLPHVTRLDGLADLKSLRRLILETRPSWDGSKVTQVESLGPFATFLSKRSTCSESGPSPSRWTTY